MNIVSTLLPPTDGVALLVMDTVCHGKSLITTLAVGDLRKDRISDVGNQCIAKAGAHMNANYPEGKVWMIEIRVAAHVDERVTTALEQANNGDLLVFVCKTPALYDAVFPHLGFTHGPAGFRTM